jgi:anti-anti-sigma regulatory factor
MKPDIMIDVDAGRVQVEGEVHWGDHKSFQDALDKLVSSPAKSLVLDLSGATFVFSSVIASLLTSAASAEARGKTLHIIIPKSLDWLKKYISQNVPSRRFPGISIGDA